MTAFVLIASTCSLTVKHGGLKISDMNTILSSLSVKKKHPYSICFSLEMVSKNTGLVCLQRADRLSTSRILDVIQILLRSVVYHTEADV